VEDSWMNGGRVEYLWKEGGRMEGNYGTQSGG
jgi:hypothetical protein